MNLETVHEMTPAELAVFDGKLPDNVIALKRRIDAAADRAAVDRAIADYQTLTTQADDPPPSLDQQVDEFLDKQQRIWSGEEPEGFPWGFGPLDKAMLLRPGNLYVLAGSKGSSKTKLLCAVALANLRQGTPVAFFSLEMSAVNIVGRLCSTIADFDSCLVHRKGTTAELWAPVVDAANELRTMPLHIDDSAHLTRTQIVERVTAWKSSHDGPAVCLVDFLQRLGRDGGSGQDSDATFLRDTSYALAGAAKTHNVAILMAAQLNKMADGVRPHIGHLEGSGGPAQAASGVILLDLLKARDDRHKAKGDADTHGKEPLDILVAKNREDESGQTIHAVADLAVGRYYERSARDELF